MMKMKICIKIKEFYDKVYERLEALNFYSEKVSNYKKDFSKILDLLNELSVSLLYY